MVGIEIIKNLNRKEQQIDHHNGQFTQPAVFLSWVHESGVKNKNNSIRYYYWKILNN